MSAVLADDVKNILYSTFCPDTIKNQSFQEVIHKEPLSVSNQDPNHVTILSRSSSSSQIGPRPIIPFHVRLSNYNKIRERIFNEDPKITRSNARMRNFWKNVKLFRKNFNISILERPGDVRPYAEVRLLGKSMMGLLDTGASVTCLGSQAAIDFLSSQTPYKKLNTKVNTADGKPQNIVGVFTTEIVFREKSLPMTIYIVPSLSQNLILGIDFWRLYNLLPLSLINNVSSLGMSFNIDNLLDQKNLTLEQ